MSGYIIDPMWFYWVDVFDKLDLVFGILAIFMGAAGFTILLIYSSNHYIDEEKPNPRVMQWMKIWIVTTGMLILLAILIPSKETMIQMQLAKFGTYENVESVIKAVQDATDYILEHLK